MIILKRWKAILAWAAIDVLMAEVAMWLVNLHPPHIPEWIAIFFLLAGTAGGAMYCCVSTDEEREAV